MDKTWFLLLFCLVLGSLSAQTGLFDLYFGQDKSEAIEFLDEYGFTLSNTISQTLSFENETNDYVHKIDLTFDEEDKLLSWDIYYNFVEDEDIEDLVYDALIERHGDDYEYDDEFDLRTWYLEEDHCVTAGIEMTYEFYLVSYYPN